MARSRRHPLSDELSDRSIIEDPESNVGHEVAPSRIEVLGERPTSEGNESGATSTNISLDGSSGDHQVGISVGTSMAPTELESHAGSSFVESEANQAVRSTSTINAVPPPLDIQQNIAVSPLAVPEMIVILIDHYLDKGIPTDSMNLRNVHALKQFVLLKLDIPGDSEIALVTIEPQKTTWLTAFSSDKNYLCNTLSEVVFEKEVDVAIDISPVFGEIFNLIPEPEYSDNHLPPKYTIRLIFVCCNSFNSPRLNFADPEFLKFASSPCCVMDVIYLHDNPCEGNQVEDILKDLASFVSPRSYLLESSNRNLYNINDQMSKLLAHPNQRQNQTTWKF